MPTTAFEFYRQLHGDNTEFLSKQSVIEFAEQFARKFYTQKLQEFTGINDSYSEPRKKFPDPPIKDLP